MSDNPFGDDTDWIDRLIDKWCKFLDKLCGYK